MDFPEYKIRNCYESQGVCKVEKSNDLNQVFHKYCENRQRKFDYEFISLFIISLHPDISDVELDYNKLDYIDIIKLWLNSDIVTKNIQGKIFENLDIIVVSDDFEKEYTIDEIADIIMDSGIDREIMNNIYYTIIDNLPKKLSELFYIRPYKIMDKNELCDILSNILKQLVKDINNNKIPIPEDLQDMIEAFKNDPNIQKLSNEDKMDYFAKIIGKFIFNSKKIALENKLYFATISLISVGLISSGLSLAGVGLYSTLSYMATRVALGFIMNSITGLYGRTLKGSVAKIIENIK